MISTVVEVFLFGPSPVFPEGVSVIVDEHSLQRHDALCSLELPAHSSEFQLVIDQVSACPFDNAPADGISAFQSDLVPHVLSVPFDIPDDLAQGILLGVGELPLGQPLLEPADKPSGLSLKEHFQSFAHEISGLWALLVIETEGSFIAVARSFLRLLRDSFSRSDRECDLSWSWLGHCDLPPHYVPHVKL
jgi:hypothetical protein